MTHTPSSPRFVNSAIAILISLTFAQGCSSNAPDLGDVRGTVTLDNQPLAGATIRFIPEGEGRASLGRTDEQGNYEMLYSTSAKGSRVGRVRVEITTAKEVADKFGTSRMMPEKLPERYNVHSELTAEIKPRSNVIDFDLKSK